MAVIRVYDEAGRVIETHEHAGEAYGFCRFHQKSRRREPVNTKPTRRCEQANG
jgi:hypothetical protein